MTISDTDTERVVQVILDRETAIRFQQFVAESGLSRSAAGKFAIKKFLDFFVPSITNIRTEQTTADTPAEPIAK